MVARRDEVVARALGAGHRQYGRRDLHEALSLHRAAEGRDDLGAKDYVRLHLGVAQVEIAVAEPRGLVRLAGAVYLEGQLVIPAAAQHLQLLRDYLYVARGQLRVLAGALTYRALDAYRALARHGLEGPDHLLRLRHDLGRAVEVAHDDEGQRGGDLAYVLHPAYDLDALARVLQPQLAAVVCP